MANNGFPPSARWHGHRESMQKNGKSLDFWNQPLQGSSPGLSVPLLNCPGQVVFMAFEIIASPVT